MRLSKRQTDFGLVWRRKACLVRVQSPTDACGELGSIHKQGDAPGPVMASGTFVGDRTVSVLCVLCCLRVMHVGNGNRCRLESPDQSQCHQLAGVRRYPLPGWKAAGCSTAGTQRRRGVPAHCGGITLCLGSLLEKTNAPRRYCQTYRCGTDLFTNRLLEQMGA